VQEPIPVAAGHNDIQFPEGAAMSKPMPFPGESPTISLAMAAGQQYGLQPDAKKPSKGVKKAKPKAKKAAKSVAKSARSPRRKAG
jgi:hypothetical protein